MVKKDGIEVIFEQPDIVELEAVGGPLPESPVHVDDALRFAFGLRDRAINLMEGVVVEPGERNHKVAETIKCYGRIHQRVLAACPDEALALIASSAPSPH